MRVFLIIPCFFVGVDGMDEETADATYVSWLYWNALYEHNDPYRFSAPDGVAALLALDVTKVELSLRGIVGALASSFNVALTGLAETLRSVCARVLLLTPTVISLSLCGDTDEQGFSLLCTISIEPTLSVTRRFREDTIGTLSFFAHDFLDKNFKIPCLVEGNGEDCSICISPMVGQCVLTQCNHMFHVPCLATVQRHAGRGYDATCPLCRSPLKMGDLSPFTR